MTLRVAILTVSDRSSAGQREDLSGPALEETIKEQGWQVSDSAVVPDDMKPIQQALIKWADSGEIDIVLTTGGTGFAPRDVTPEATLDVIERDKDEDEDEPAREEPSPQDPGASEEEPPEPPAAPPP